MDFNDFKVYFLSATGFMLTFSNMEDALKIILLIVSIVYTIIKIVEITTGKNKKNGSDNN
jgi:hypothetical protein